MEKDALTLQELNEINAIVRKWAMERQHELIANVKALGLVRTGKLLKSIKATVQMSQGEASAIKFKYQYYGLFHDVGAKNVGRGKIDLPAGHWMARHIINDEKIGQLLDQLSNYYMTIMINAIKIDSVKA